LRFEASQENSSPDLILKKSNTKNCAAGVASVIEHLPSKCRNPKFKPKSQYLKKKKPRYMLKLR
jgi:hypothetical protein